MRNDNNNAFQFSLDDQFRLPRVANLDTITRVRNRRTDKEGRFTAPVVFLHDLVLFPRAISPLTFPSGSGGWGTVSNAIQEQSTVIGCYGDPDDKSEESNRYLTIGLEIAVGQDFEGEPGTHTVLAQARRRVHILDMFLEEGVPMVLVEPVAEKSRRTQHLTALMRVVNKRFEQYLEANDTLPDDLVSFAGSIEDPAELADFIAASVDFGYRKRLDLLAAVNPEERLTYLEGALQSEIKLAELESKIQSDVQSELDRGQRDAYLREQIARMQKELSDGRYSDPETQSLAEQLAAIELPAEAREAADKELERLQNTPPLSPESGMLSAYLRWLADLPWTEATEDDLDIQKAKTILDSNHHALKKAKDRILEYLAVRSLQPKRNRQPILCFVGAPGTGKTSLGRSIAEAMGRKFVRLSLGGVHDEAEIRGHRRTYLGALPGRILQTMRKVKVTNPLFMLDEIDKLNSDFQGDPAAALLEVLDPEQNNSFSDHYLEVPYDLSKVFFITTANNSQAIPPALLDRMEIIEFPGYILEDKQAIARSFLIPKQLEESGLHDEAIDFTDEAVARLVESYTYEAGVRNLEREIGSVLRKLARIKTEGREMPTKVTADLVTELLGPVQYFPMSAEAEDEIGVSTAMAWTENGGEIMPVEVLTVPGKSNTQITGQIGEIMQESAQAALSYLKSRSEAFGIPENLFEETDIHIHVPEGAIPKDGPSAGITLATALTSAVLGVPVHHEVAMSGEITLRGRVLPIGGVREKVLAAQRSGIRTIILPKRNEKDLVDVPAAALESLSIHFVEHMDEVLAVALAGTPRYAREIKPVKQKRSAPKTKGAPEKSD